MELIVVSPKKSKTKMSIDEKRNINLNEIYSFYCKQTSVNGKHATFERLS